MRGVLDERRAPFGGGQLRAEVVSSCVRGASSISAGMAWYFKG